MTTMKADALMCRYAFDVLISHTDELEAPEAPKEIPDVSTYAVFVTWKKKVHPDRMYQLRGCIGSLAPLPLREGLKNYAFAAAFQDRRFPPIHEVEINDLQVSISLLGNFEKARRIFDWTIGTHGLIVDFKVGGKTLSATYLPEVCAEQNWSKEECLRSLMRKAGYSGVITRELFHSIRVTRYQSSKHSLFYDEYRDMIHAEAPKQYS